MTLRKRLRMQQWTASADPASTGQLIDDARERLIVALDVPSAAAAQQIVAAVGDSVTDAWRTPKRIRERDGAH